MTQTLSERASVSGESINILSVAVYRNQVHVNIGATLPCGINNIYYKRLSKGDEDSTPVRGVPYEPPASSSTTISYDLLY